MFVITTNKGLKFSVCDGETILDAVEKTGATFSYSCRNGRCGSCKGKLIFGESNALHEELGLSKKERKDGWILTCVRTATSDIYLDIVDLGNLPLPQVVTLPVKISQLEKLSSDVMKVVLRIPPSRKFNFYPGQYIEVIGHGNTRRSYSLANASAHDKLLELHIRSVSDGILSNYWFHQAKINDLLRINGPLGTFFLRNVSGLHLVFLATGTGIAPVKSMLEGLNALSQSDQPLSVTVYWGRQRQEDLYEISNGNAPQFRYVPVLSQAGPDWSGVKGYVQHAYLVDTPDQSNRVVYACGSDAMIHDAKKSLVEAGLPEYRFMSDAFVSSAAN